MHTKSTQKRILLTVLHYPAWTGRTRHGVKKSQIHCFNHDYFHKCPNMEKNTRLSHLKDELTMICNIIQYLVFIKHPQWPPIFFNNNFV